MDSHLQRRTDAADSPAWHQRVDRGALMPPKTRADGTLLVEGYAAREGVLEYRQADGTVRRELVPLATLNASAAGLARTSVTLEHPREDVSPNNVGALGVGDTDGEVIVEDGGFVRVRLAVRRADAIQAIRNGKQELSPGYAVRLDPTPGVHPVHGRYDAVQIERKYNHLAIVGVARGGPEVRMRTDSGDAVATTTIRRDSAPNQGAAPQEVRMNSRFLRLLSLLGITSRIDSDDAAIDAAVDAISARKDSLDKAEREAQAKVAAAEQAQATEKARADAADTARAAEKTRADTAEAEVARLKGLEAKRADAEERKGLDEIAAKLGVNVPEKLDNKGLRRLIAGTHLGREIRADESDETIRGVVEAAGVAASERADGLAAGTAVWVDTATAGGAKRTDAQPRRSTMASRWGGRPVRGEQ